MAREYVWAAISFVIVAFIGVLLLALAAHGVMPKGFGLFDQSQWSVRAVTFVILAIIGVVLFLALRREDRSS